MYNSQELVELLQTKIKFISENHNEYVFRCPYCGDSENPNHGHLYISKDDPVFHCKRCNEGIGKTVNDLLIFLNLPTIDIGESSSIKKNVITPDMDSVQSLYTAQSLFDYSEEEKELLHKWIVYTSKRLGVRKREIYGNIEMLSFLNIPYFKENVHTFYNFSNEFEFYKEKLLDGTIIPFLTWNNRFIIGRIIKHYSINKTRYLFLSLLEDQFEDLYVIKDRSCDESINTVIISEGVFDTIGLFYYLKDEVDLCKTVWVSVLSNSYIRGLRFANMNFQLPLDDLQIKVFMDNDSGITNNLKQFEKALNRFSDLYTPGNVEVYINSLDKDYGVPRIKLSKITSF